MGDFLKLQILAVLQGLTEFLPVSSSGHLTLMRAWLGVAEPGDAGPVLELLLHVGTLVAVIYYYRKRIAELIVGLLKREAAAWKYSLAIVVSCIPAGILYALANDWLEQTFDKPWVVAVLLILNGCMMLSLKIAPAGSGKMNFGRALVMGCAQAVAMLPGVSRSGSTYACGRWCKTGSGEAFDFAFMMSIPIIGGAIILKLKDFCQLAGQGGGMCAGLIVATILSAVVGLAALKFLSMLRISGKMWYFGIYCLIVGFISAISQFFC